MNDGALNIASKYHDDSDKLAVALTLSEDINRRAINSHIVAMVLKLKVLLENRFANDNPEIQAALEFLYTYLNQTNQTEDSSNQIEQSAITRLQHKLVLSDVEIEILVLAGMAHDHEAFADIFRSLHPNHKCFPTAALLLQLLCFDEQQRHQLSVQLTNSKLFRYGLISLLGDSPILTRSLVIDANDWHAIVTGKPHLTHQHISHDDISYAGMDDWLNSKQVLNARICIEEDKNALILLKGSEVICAINRAKLLAHSQSKSLLCVPVNQTTDNQTYKKIALHCVISNQIPLLILDAGESKSAIVTQGLNDFLGCVLLCGMTNQAIEQGDKFTIELSVDRLSVNNLIQMWQNLLPELQSSSHHLAARFPLDPSIASLKVKMFRSLARQEDDAYTFDKVVAFFKQNLGGAIPEGIKRLTPNITWSELILPEMQKNQLAESTNRLVLQHQVLDEWKFLENRRGAKGVRLLFSGPPGTGKTMAAEVLANRLEVDLLIIDLASVVSKWIGETEKNLAKVFNYAEQSQAVLFFDEADAIFGKRTEVSDSHDRYANLETAYLLTRLEAYEGMAILATNYKNNIDGAFIRRLDYIIDFREPGVSDRQRLWRSHVPETAPIHSSVNFAELATLYPMVGGEIRNAAVAAGYFAAQKQLDIHQDHFVNAIRREYEKTGKAFREVNAF